MHVCVRVFDYVCCVCVYFFKSDVNMCAPAIHNVRSSLSLSHSHTPHLCVCGIVQWDEQDLNPEQMRSSSPGSSQPSTFSSHTSSSDRFVLPANVTDSIARTGVVFKGQTTRK